MRGNMSVLPSGDREALKSFSLLGNYLRNFESGELDDRLSIAKTSIEKAEANHQIDAEELQKTKELFQRLLDCIRQEGRTGVSFRPREVRFGTLGRHN